MSRTVLFAAPFPSYDVMRFVRALAGLADVRLVGIFGRDDEEARALCHDVAVVGDVTDVGQLARAVEWAQRTHGTPHRLLGINEVLMEQLAQVRERFGLPGTPAKTARLFREKAEMKEALRAAGLPVARHALLTGASDALAFLGEVGLPLVLKPPAGVGAKSTYRVRTIGQLRDALDRMQPGPGSPVLAEELLTGTEHSFETVTVGGVPRAVSFADYHPGCLEVLENPWIQWTCVLPREVDRPAYALAQAAGTKAIAALGLDDGMTHMEWFARADGSIAIGEIAQRPPGPQLCQMTGLVHDVDIYRAWARAVVDGAFDGPWVRRYAAGAAFVRGQGHGAVTAVRGVRELHEALGDSLVEARLPVIGKPKNESYEGDGVIVVRDPSTARVRELLKTTVETLRVHYG